MPYRYRAAGERSALRLLDEDERFCAAVREGIAAGDRGELIKDDAVHLRLEEWKHS